MGLFSIYRFIIRGFIVLLLVNLVRPSIIKRDVNLSLSIEAEVEANHLISLGRIVNGSVAIRGQFPHQVSLRNTVTGNHFCGGNIIHAEWILTAAHCMFLQSGEQLQPWMITIVAGDIWLNRTLSTSQRSPVTQIIIHENFDRLTMENDVTLLRLTRKFTFENSDVQYQLLRTDPVANGTMCQVAGWGYPAADVPLVSNVLMYVNVPIISQKLCRNLYKEYSDIPDGMICAGYVEGMKDACQGDSGGGLICDGILTGIVSWGEGCAWPNYPGVYTDVRIYKNWIYQRSNNFLGGNANMIKSSLWMKFFLSLTVIELIIST